MIAITMRSSIRVKIFIFTLEGRTDEQGTGKHLNNGRKKGEVRQDRDWHRSLLEIVSHRETR